MTKTRTETVSYELKNMDPYFKKELLEFLRVNVIHPVSRTNGHDDTYFSGSFSIQHSEKLDRWLEENERKVVYEHNGGG